MWSWMNLGALGCTIYSTHLRIREIGGQVVRWSGGQQNQKATSGGIGFTYDLEVRSTFIKAKQS